MSNSTPETGVPGIVNRMMSPDVMPRPVEVRALEPYRLWLRYDDGVEGEVDLSHLAGKGVFAAWEDPAFFAGVYIGSIARNTATEANHSTLAQTPTLTPCTGTASATTCSPCAGCSS